MESNKYNLRKEPTKSNKGKENEDITKDKSKRKSEKLQVRHTTDLPESSLFLPAEINQGELERTTTEQELQDRSEIVETGAELMQTKEDRPTQHSPEIDIVSLIQSLTLTLTEKLSETKMEISNNVNVQLTEKLAENKNELRQQLSANKVEVTKTLTENMNQQLNENKCILQKQIQETKEELFRQNENNQKIYNEQLTAMADGVQNQLSVFDKKVNAAISTLREEVEGKLLNYQEATSKQFDKLTDYVFSVIEHGMTEKIDQNSKEMNKKFENLNLNIEKCKIEVNQLKTESESSKLGEQIKIEDQKREMDSIRTQLVIMAEANQEIKQSLENEIKKKQQNLPSEINITCNSSMMEANIPRCNGREKNPVDFLRKIKNFWEKTQRKSIGGQKMSLPEVLEIAMEGHASRWWSIRKEKIENIEEFEEEYLRKYWNFQIQHATKRRIEAEKYVKGGKLTRSEYFIQKVNILQCLTPILEENEIVTILAEHFDQRTQDARRVQNINTIPEFENYLTQEDIEEKTRVMKEAYQRMDQPRRTTEERRFKPAPREETRYAERNQRKWMEQRPYYQPRSTPYTRGEVDQMQRRGGAVRPVNYLDGARRGGYQENRYMTRRDEARGDEVRREPGGREERRVYPTPEQNRVCRMLTINRSRPPETQTASNQQPQQTQTNTSEQQEN